MPGRATHERHTCGAERGPRVLGGETPRGPPSAEPTVSAWQCPARGAKPCCWSGDTPNQQPAISVIGWQPDQLAKALA